MIRVIIESPYAGDVERNLEYLRACLKDSLSRGEAPYASHALYTQPGVLDDGIAHERDLGIEAGLLWGEVCDLVAVYIDLGLSAGMRFGIERHTANGKRIEFRKLGGKWA